jgi:vacuolar protein sorting-associated protein 26
LGGYDLTPTMKDVQRKFSVRYFLNLVLVDEEERRYFKQQVMSFVNKTKVNFLLKFSGNCPLAKTR